MCQVVREGRNVRGSFLPFWNKTKKNKGESKTIRWIKSKEKKEKKDSKEKNEEEEKKTRGEPCVRVRGKIEDFPAFRQSKLDGLRIKVGPRNESYAWVPKLERFIKLQEVGGFSYLVYFLLKGHSMAIWYNSKHRASSRAVQKELRVI